MIPGDAQVKIKCPFRVGVPGFDALEVHPPSVFVYHEIRFHRQPVLLSFAGATLAQEPFRGLPMPALEHHGAAV